MKSLLINYATERFFKSQKLNSASGITHGLSGVIQWSSQDIDQKFKEANKKILDLPRGAGYWLWKPYFILKSLSLVDAGDIVFYSDAGAVFIRDVNPILDICKESSSGVTTFRLSGGHKEGEYTRREVMEKIGVDSEKVRKSNQHMASFCLFRKCTYTVDFLNSWLSYCRQPDIITDTAGDISSFPEFKDHRHDQSVLSLLIKKNNLSPLADPTQWGIIHKETSASDHFIHHHRNDPSELCKLS